MIVAKKIKMLLVEKETNITELAQRLGTSQPNLSNKMKRDNFSEKEIAEIAKALDVRYEINFVLDNGDKI